MSPATNPRVRSVALLGALLLAGCIQAPPAPFPEASQRSFDGLYPLANVRVDAAWARPDIDLSAYDRILLDEVEIEFRPVDRSGSAFPLDAAQQARLGEVVRAAFLEELGRSEAFSLTTEPGPDVLVVRASLLDVVSRVPPESVLGADVYLESVGEATLSVELVDPENRSVLLRAVDRRAAGAPGRPFRASRVRNWQEVRTLADAWARRLRLGLDALHDRMTIE